MNGRNMALNPIYKGATRFARVAASQGPGDEQKQYSPREREKYNGRDLQTVRHSGKDENGRAKGKQSGIIKTQKVIENRNEVKSL